MIELVRCSNQACRSSCYHKRRHELKHIPAGGTCASNRCAMFGGICEPIKATTEDSSAVDACTVAKEALESEAKG